MKLSPAKVVVVGSLNIDYIASVSRLPGPGETVSAEGLVQRFGGKGANQAVAAARQGSRVSMIGCVGGDEHGRAYKQRLRSEGIDAVLKTTPRALTGTALIAVDQRAENMIVVAPGANGELKPAAVRAQQTVIASANVLLLQLEVPLAAVTEAIRLANRAQVPVVLNPSPWRGDFPWTNGDVETLIVNSGEAEAIFALPSSGIPRQLAQWRRELAARRIRRLIITRGANPTLLLTPEVFEEVPTLAVKPVDTVGAGDAFAGAFAARIAAGTDLVAAVRYANCAGALSTLKAGAQESIPSRGATGQALRRLKVA